MTGVIPNDFDARAEAWLADEAATGLPEAEHLHRPSDAYLAAQRAFAEAESHAFCPVEDRDYTVIVRVFGKDRQETYIQIPPAASLPCIMRALYADPEVLQYEIIGPEPPAGPAEDTVAEVEVPASEAPATWATDEGDQDDYVTLGTWALAGLAAVTLAAAAYLTWRHRR